MLNKVPEVTLYFWVIKILCTTVGETFADNLDQKLNLGPTKLGILMSGVLVVSLVFQFRSRRYIPGVYWLAVVLISVVFEHEHHHLDVSGHGHGIAPPGGAISEGADA